MKRTIQLALLLSLATIGYAQGDPTPYLIYSFGWRDIDFRSGVWSPSAGGKSPTAVVRDISYWAVAVFAVLVVVVQVLR